MGTFILGLFTGQSLLDPAATFVWLLGIEEETIFHQTLALTVHPLLWKIRPDCGAGFALGGLLGENVGVPP